MCVGYNHRSEIIHVISNNNFENKTIAKQKSNLNGSKFDLESVQVVKWYLKLSFSKEIMSALLPINILSSSFHVMLPKVKQTDWSRRLTTPRPSRNPPQTFT